MSAPYKPIAWANEHAAHTATYLLPPLLELAGNLPPKARVLDVGCGNGFVAGQFLARGCDVVGVDVSPDGIAIARAAHPHARFEVLPADAQLLETLNVPPFDLVISTEVVEHLYEPRAYVRGCFAATRPGGRFICSTPYHGYLKNLALALTGKLERHWDPLWDGGHIKFWSARTLGALFRAAGFTNLRFAGAGRLPYLWKSMLLAGDRPA